MTRAPNHAHRRASEITEALSEFGLPGRDCRRIGSILTTAASIDLAALEAAVAFHGKTDDLDVLVGFVRHMRRKS